MATLHDIIYSENVAACLWEQKRASYIEIFDFEDEVNPWIREGEFGVSESKDRLKTIDRTGDLEDFLDYKGPFQKPASSLGKPIVGGLRIIAQTGSHDYMNDGRMKMTYTNMKMLLDSLRMPKRFPLTRAWRVPIYLCSELRPSCTEEGDKYLVSTFISPRFRWATPLMFLSYERETSITTVYLLLQDFEEWFDFTQVLRQAGTQAKHPMLVPMLLWHRITGRFEAANRRDLERLLAVKRGTGLSDFFDDNADPVANVADAHQAIVSAYDGATEADARLLLTLSKYSAESFATLKKCLSKSQGMLLERDTESLWEIHRYLEGTAHAEWDCMNTLRQRIEMTQRVLYTMVQQRDTVLSQQIAIDSKKVAEASKRDSSSMKTIAALTMIFLPGTAVATMFSTPFFSDSNGSVEVAGNFRLFWIISAPLTIAVLGLWVVWMFFTSRKHDREFHEIEVAGGMHKAKPQPNTHALRKSQQDRAIEHQSAKFGSAYKTSDDTS